MQEWIPDAVWLSVVALSAVDAFRDLPDSVFRNDGLWRQWYDQEAPELAKVRVGGWEWGWGRWNALAACWLLVCGTVAGPHCPRLG